LKQLVAPGKAQCFLDACIKTLQRMHKQNNFTDRQKIGQAYMLTIIASLKALPGAKGNTLVSYRSPFPVRF
jgi:hypothetical protein